MERVDGGRKMHLVVFDLRNSIAGDVRFRTVGSTLRRAAVLAYSTADSGPWTHCGVTCVREDGLQVPLKLTPLRLITIGQLDQVFNQIDEIIKTQIDLHLLKRENETKKSDLTTALKNVLKQCSELKAAKGDVLISVVTLRWEGPVKSEMLQFLRECGDGRPRISSNVQIIEIGDDSGERYYDQVEIVTVPFTGISIAMEIHFKSWLKKAGPKLVLDFSGRDVELVCLLDSAFIDTEGLIQTDSSSAAPSKYPKRLTLDSFVPAQSMCPSLMYGRPCSLVPLASPMENYYRHEALCRFIEEKQVAIVAQSDEEIRRTFVLFPGFDLRMTLQPMAGTDQILPLRSNEELMTIRPSVEFDSMARTLPISDSYGVGCEANLIDHLKEIWATITLKNRSNAEATCTVKQRQRTARSMEQTKKATKTAFEAYAHPALAMYRGK